MNLALMNTVVLKLSEADNLYVKLSTERRMYLGQHDVYVRYSTDDKYSPWHITSQVSYADVPCLLEFEEEYGSLYITFPECVKLFEEGTTVNFHDVQLLPISGMYEVQTFGNRLLFTVGNDVFHIPIKQCMCHVNGRTVPYNAGIMQFTENPVMISVTDKVYMMSGVEVEMPVDKMLAYKVCLKYFSNTPNELLVNSLSVLLHTVDCHYVKDFPACIHKYFYIHENKNDDIYCTALGILFGDDFVTYYVNSEYTISDIVYVKCLQKFIPYDNKGNDIQVALLQLTQTPNVWDNRIYLREHLGVDLQHVTTEQIHNCKDMDTCLQLIQKLKASES